MAAGFDIYIEKVGMPCNLRPQEEIDDDRAVADVAKYDLRGWF
jgi:hypothetical protein